MKNINKINILICIITVIISMFISKYTSLIKNFESTAKSKEALINQHVELSSNFIDIMTIYGNDFFQQSKESNLYSFLKYNPSLNNYNLDAVGGTEYEKTIGNLSGVGSIPESGMNRDEVYLAFQYNKFFSSFYNILPDVAWLYYTSENNFINMYPWISSKDFTFTENLKTSEFYIHVTPQNNPLRKPFWTPVYFDHAGKGLMVTLSSPIYNKDIFKGVVSLDFTNVQLSKMIDSEYESYLIDDTDSIIATSLNIKFDKEVIKINALLNSPQSDIKRMKEVKENTVQRLGKYYIYSVGFRNAPWKMFLRVPVWSIVFQSTLFTLPILVISILLLLTVHEVEKRKRTETLLTNSIEELKTYHELLENAAKYDFLTKTYNRRGLKESFNKNIALNRITRIPVSFILGDIDFFKQLNDTFGHAAGDKVLIEITNIMKKNISNKDVVCRWGGEEFLIMLLNRTYADVILIAKNIRKEIETIVIPWENSVNIRATMTFGVAEYDYDDSIENCISKADSALYVGKGNGRNQVISYEDCL